MTLRRAILDRASKAFAELHVRHGDPIPRDEYERAVTDAAHLAIIDAIIHASMDTDFRRVANLDDPSHD